MEIVKVGALLRQADRHCCNEAAWCLLCRQPDADLAGMESGFIGCH